MGFLFGSAKAATLPATTQPAATLPAETPAVPVKETDAEVRKKKQRTSRLARTRLGHGATVKTSGRGVQVAANTQRKALLGDCLGH